MITIQFFSDFERISCVKIDTGKLTGREKPSSLKAALMEMEIENPCVTFSRDYKAGRYRSDYNLIETTEIADTCNFLSDLWQLDYSRNAPMDRICAKINPLKLLENALTLVIQQQLTIIELKKKCGKTF